MDNKARTRGAAKGTRRSKYNITGAKIADWFGLKSEAVLNNSTAKHRYLNGVDKVVEHIEGQLIERLK